jgi:hypothetical protein
MRDLAAEAMALCELVSKFPAVPVRITSAVLAGYLGAGMTLLDALQATQLRLTDACSDNGSGIGVLEPENPADAGHVEHAHDLTRYVA